MNEQIKELAHKAEFINKRHNGDEWRWGYIDPELADKLEKFAELIVRECARVYWNIDDSETHTEYVEALKQHFGVEE